MIASQIMELALPLPCPRSTDKTSNSVANRTPCLSFSPDPEMGYVYRKKIMVVVMRTGVSTLTRDRRLTLKGTPVDDANLQLRRGSLIEVVLGWAGA